MWNDEAQRLPREELRALQSRRLQDQVARIYDRVGWYRQRLADSGVQADQIASLADLARLPFTAKSDLREVFPFGLSAVPQGELVEVHMSSGSTGKPVVNAYTRGDLELWGDMMARTLDMGGVGADDIVQNTFGYGLFTGGFGVHYGAEAIGALVLPISSGNTRRQLDTIADFGTTTLTGTPSYALYLAEYARENGVDPRSFGLKRGFFGAEPWSEPMRAQIEDDWGIEAFDIYGLTEIIGPGVGSECREHDGLHLQEDHFYPEVVDPDTGLEIRMDIHSGMDHIQIPPSFPAENLLFGKRLRSCMLRPVIIIRRCGGCKPLTPFGAAGSSSPAPSPAGSPSSAPPRCSPAAAKPHGQRNTPRWQRTPAPA